MSKIELKHIDKFYGKNHILEHKSPARKRNLRKAALVHKTDKEHVAKMLRVRVIAGVCKAAVTGQLRLQRFQARVRDSGRRERKARAGKCFHHGLAAQAVADKADFFHGDSFFPVFFDAHARTALHLL